MSRPRCVVTVDSKPVTEAFLRRLSECEVTDKDGVSSDTVRLRLDDDPPAEIPQPGARIEVAMGYEGNVVRMGSYLAEEVEVECLPYAITITGKAAEMGGPAKEMKRRHWDDVTLQDVVSDLAAEIGVQPAVDAALGAFRYDWLGQYLFDTLQEVQDFATRWLWHYNHERPNMGLGGITPKQKLAMVA